MFFSSKSGSLKFTKNCIRITVKVIFESLFIVKKSGLDPIPSNLSLDKIELKFYIN